MRLYRLLLLAFPAAFRRRFSADMAATFADRRRHARGPAAAAGLWLRTIGDVVSHGLAERQIERRHHVTRRSPMLSSIVQDLRYAGRSFRQRPGFAAVALATLALGIGANTAIFTVVHAVLIRDLPFPDADRIVRLYATHRQYNFDRGVLNPFDYTYVETRASSLASLSTVRGCSTTLTGAGAPARLSCTSVMPSFFDVMAVRPAAGRPFNDMDAIAAAASSRGGATSGSAVVLISHELWRTRFGQRADIVGRSIQLDDIAHEVIGVMPDGFDFPSDTEVWRPFMLSADERQQMGSWYLGAVGRLRSDVTLEAAAREVEALAAELERTFPEKRQHRGLRLVALKADLASRAASGLRLLQGVVIFVLLIACANVANLLLVQATGRGREFGIRASIGASRWRLVRQSLTESLALAAGGALLGVLLAFWGVRALVALAPPFLLPDPETIAIGWPVLVVTAAAAAGTGVVFGLTPAWMSARPALAELLHAGGRAAATGLSLTRRQWLRAGLVAGEVALAVVLLAGAALLVRSFTTLLGQAPGIEPRNVLTAQVTLPLARYPTPADRHVFWSALVDRLAATPGVTEAAASNALPFSTWEWQSDFRIKGREDAPNDGAGTRTVTPRLFRALGIPLVAGRTFTDDDARGGTPVVIVSDEFVRQHMGGLDPIGQQLTFNAARPVWATIVGVVGSTRHYGLHEDLRAEIYSPLTPDRSPTTMLLALRTTTEPLARAAAIHGAVADLDPALPVLEVKTMVELMRARSAERRFYVTLLTLFAALAGALAASGIYGVMSYVVGQGRREIGIRLALGATPARVSRRVLRQGLTVVALGAIAGLVGARALSAFLEPELFRVTTADPAAYALALASLASVAALACWIPARRTGRVDVASVIRD